MSSNNANKENVPPRRKIPWFKHHNPGTRYTYDGPRRPRVQVLSSVLVVPPKPDPRQANQLPPPTSRPLVAPPQTPRRPPPQTRVPETPRRARPSGKPRRLELRPQNQTLPSRTQPKAEGGPRHYQRRPSGRSRSPIRWPRPREHRPRARTPSKTRFRPPPPRSPSPPARVVVTRVKGMRPDIPWVAPHRLNLIKPSRPRFHDSTGRDPRSRKVQVIVTLPPPDAPVLRSATPPLPRVSPVPSPVRPLPPTPPCIKVPGPQPRSKIVYYRGSLVPGRPRRHISLAYYPQEDA